MKSVFEQQGQEFNHRELGVGLDPSEVDAHEETEEICELLNVATREKEKALRKKTRKGAPRESNFIEIVIEATQNLLIQSKVTIKQQWND